MRFSNQMFEPLWNSNYVDHVQITMAEDIGIGSRAGYYDGVGAARDVIQNHLLQLLALTAMEEPLSLDAKHLRAEKLRSSKHSALTICRTPSRSASMLQATRAENTSTASSTKMTSLQTPHRNFCGAEGLIANRRWEGTPSTCAPVSAWPPRHRNRGGLQESPPTVSSAKAKPAGRPERRRYSCAAR